ncbi:RNA recognition family protein [Cryptosporidium andersoni]|uniref:RNA recognition family protein n=1 Tax=Cryptosporidium andersoni TaxID=117008 RepID=A0A1J4MQT7_9CRYT|nr:RNA recognition family protein [Cryptosporidium andersoni]
MFRSGPYDRNYESRGGPYPHSVTYPPSHIHPSLDSYSNSSNGYRAHPGSLDDPTAEAYVSRTLYLCKLPYDMTEEAVRELCEPFGDLKKVAVYPQKGIAFVEYFDIRKAEIARNTLKNSQVQGRIIDVQYSRGRDDRPSRDTNTGTLYVRPVVNDKGFVDPNTVDDYKQLFGAYGDVKKVSSNRKREAEKFVEFYDTRGAEASQKALNGYDFNGVVLEIQFANTHSRTINADSKVMSKNYHPSGGHQTQQNHDCYRSQALSGPIRQTRFTRNASPDIYGDSFSRRIPQQSPNVSVYTGTRPPRRYDNIRVPTTDYNNNATTQHYNDNLSYQHTSTISSYPSQPQVNNNSSTASGTPALASLLAKNPSASGNLAASLKTLLSTLQGSGSNTTSTTCSTGTNDSTGNSCEIDTQTTISRNNSTTSNNGQVKVAHNPPIQALKSTLSSICPNNMANFDINTSPNTPQSHWYK